MKKLVRRLLDWYPRLLCRREYENQVFTMFKERPVEYRFVFRQIAARYPRTVLDVGTGTTALPSLIRSCGCLVTAMDNVRDFWPKGMLNRHYHVVDDDIRAPRVRGPFDMITCISVLEHIPDASVAVSNMLRLLSPGGLLVMTFPYTEKTYIRNVYELPESSYGRDNPYGCQSFSRAELSAWVEGKGARIVEQEYWKFWTGGAWTCGAPVLPPEASDAEEPHQLTCLAVSKER